MVNWLDNVIATDSEVSLDWVEAATNTFGELAPNFTTDVHNWCSGNFSKIELSTSLDSLKNSASFDIWLD